MEKKTIIILILHVLLNPRFIQNYSYKSYYIKVPLDHFSFTTNYTFCMRYLINDNYWNYHGPIFFYTGNEGSIDTFAENSGFIWEIAPSFRALLVFAEHRYYGKSLPFGNRSFADPQHLGYLSSSQALADYVYLLDYIKDQFGKHPVIAFGGSYGGMLSAWLRMKYPSYVMGALAASAPIWQFQGLVSCEIFNRIITFAFDIASSYKCPSLIKQSWLALRSVTSTAIGRQWLSTEWKLCKPLRTTEDIHLLKDWLEEVYGNLAMANYPYEANFIVPLPAYPIRIFCEKLCCPRRRCTFNFLLQQLGTALSIYFNHTGNSRCLDYSQSPNGGLGDIGWDFQACTEMVMPMCSGDLDMFENDSWNFTNYAAACYKKWKIRVSRADSVVLEYGGKDLRSTSNIIFSNGLLDPWSGGGVLNNVSDTVLAIVLPDTAHHLDLRASNPADPVSVKIARKFYIGVFNKWLKKYYCENP